MSRLKKIAYPAENGTFIYVPKSIIDKVCKKVIVTNQYVDERKLITEYKSKSGSSHGVMTFNDMGPDEPKKKN